MGLQLYIAAGNRAQAAMDVMYRGRSVNAAEGHRNWDSPEKSVRATSMLISEAHGDGPTRSRHSPRPRLDKFEKGRALVSVNSDKLHYSQLELEWVHTRSPPLGTPTTHAGGITAFRERKATRFGGS